MRWSRIAAFAWISLGAPAMFAAEPDYGGLDVVRFVRTST